MTSPKRPSHLYKYQPLCAQSLSNLKDRTLWFSAPAHFNDPYDCANDVVPDQLPEAEFVRLYEMMRKDANDGIRFDAKYQSGGKPNDLFRTETMNSIRSNFDARRRLHLHQRGVACLSEHVDHLLMWAHYADGHRGFCLEFDAANDPFNRAREVTYHERPALVNPVDVLDDAKEDDLDRNLIGSMLLAKSDHWAYEREWRLLHMKADHAYGYHFASLTGIYFGAAMPETHIEILAMILKGSPTKLYRMQHNPRDFSLTPIPVTYTPFNFTA